MKRSEARIIIAGLLTDLLDDEMALKRANKILAVVQDQIGMEPPYNFWVDDEADGNFWEPET